MSPPGAPGTGPIEAVLFDFGGVITDSPFDAFQRYEHDHGLPDGFIRGVNAANHLDNAWARLERSELGFDAFCDAFEAEALAAEGASTHATCSPCSPDSSGPTWSRRFGAVASTSRPAF